MEFEIKNRNFSETLGDSANLYTSALLPLLISAVLLYIPKYVVGQLQLALPLNQYVSMLMSYSVAYFVQYFEMIVLFTYLSGIVSGNIITIFKAWGTAAKKIPGLLIMAFLTSYAVLGGILLLIIPGVIFSLAWYFNIAFMSTENLGPIESMRRSWGFSKGYRGRIFGFSIFRNFLVLLPSVFLVYIPLWVTTYHVSPLLQTGVSAAYSILLSPYLTAIYTLFFYSVKTAAEGHPIVQAWEEATQAEDPTM